MAAAATLERMRPITRAEYGLMLDAGLFQRERVELWKGVLVRMSPQKSPHASAVQALTQLFILALVPSARAAVRVQLPFVLSDDSEPEPDVAVVPWGDYREQHPSTAYLLVEVADASLTFDLEEKSIGYAVAGIPEYWVVDVQAKTVTIMRDPSPDGYRLRLLESGRSPFSPAAFPDMVTTVAAIAGDPP